MKNTTGPLKQTALLCLLGLAACTAWQKNRPAPPATIEDIKAQLSLTAQQIQEAAQLRQAEFSREQTERASRIDADIKYIYEALTLLDSKIDVLHESARPTVVIADEKCPPPPQGHTADGKLLLGETEWLWLDEADHAFQARIDTGAATSSISAADITIFERDGEDWARFFMSHQDTDDRIRIEAPLVRHVRIKQASADSSDRRPVVLLSVRVGELNEKAQFTLADRSNMAFPVLLGRDFLKDIAVVDVARTYIHPKPQLKDVR